MPSPDISISTAAIALVLGLAVACSAEAQNIHKEDILETARRQGEIEGVAKVCSLSPGMNAYSTLIWQVRADDIGTVIVGYAHYFSATDDDIFLEMMLEAGSASIERQENPRALWDNPLGCGQKSSEYIDKLIGVWRRWLQQQ